MKETSNKIVSVIVVTAGVKSYVWGCLDSIKNQTYPNLEIIVVSNTFNRGFEKDISYNHPNIKLYTSKENLFYCSALNIGIGISQGDLILCLNDDLVLDKRFIEKAASGFALDRKIGMVSGKILRSNGKMIDSAGLFLSVFRTAKERGYGLRDKGQYEKEGYIFGVSGAAAFYRRDMLESIKLGKDYFDEDYHIFYEDLDSAWRANNFGWKAYYMPSAIAYHVRGATVRQGIGINMPFARRYLNDGLYLDLLKNRYLTIIKNERAIPFLLFLPFILFYDVLSWGHILFFRGALIPKIFFILQYIKPAFKKRRLIRLKKIN